jgi:hypothetical protein
MSTKIPFPGNASNMPVLPDGVVEGSRKRKQAFSLNDPDNIEVARLATQAEKKKAKLSNNLSKKKRTNQKTGSKSNRQPSVEEVEDADSTQHRAFPRNPKNIIELDDDSDKIETTEATKKKANISKPILSQKKTNNKPIPKSTRQPSVEDVDDDEARSSTKPRDSDADMDDDDDSEEVEEVEAVDQPAESAEAELSQ